MRDEVFVLDRQKGCVRRVVAATGKIGKFVLAVGGISADGRLVAFQTNASAIVHGDTNKKTDVFLHDFQSGTASRVSVGPSDKQANGDSGVDALTPDGHFVLFRSNASNLDKNDTNGKSDLFVRDLLRKRTTRVSIGTDGEQATDGVHGLRGGPGISDDGRYVVFISRDENLVPGDTNDAFDAFLHDRGTGTTKRISVSPDGEQSDEHTYSVGISGDGRYVALGSDATNFVAGDRKECQAGGEPAPEPCSDIFLLDRVTGAIELVSAYGNGLTVAGPSYLARISGSGRFVAFSTVREPDSFYCDTQACAQSFVWDRTTKTSEPLMANDQGEPQPGFWPGDISANGSHLILWPWQSYLPRLFKRSTGEATTLNKIPKSEA